MSYIVGNVSGYQSGAGGLYANESVVSGGPPTGAAGGDLTGTYPNPTIAPGVITAAEIAPGTITATQIANNTITATQIANNTITAAQIAAGTITNTEIANNTITGSKIVNATITADKLAAGTDGSCLYYDALSASWKTDNASYCCMGANTYNNAGTDCVTLGTNASTSGVLNSVAIGRNASTGGTGSVAICDGAATTGTNQVAIGGGTLASGANANALGLNAIAHLPESIALGANANVAGTAYSVGFGCNSASTTSGKFGVTLNGTGRELEAHSSIFTTDGTGGTRSLDATASRIIRYTAATQVNLPNATTLTGGFTIKILNDTVSTLPIHISTGAGLVASIDAGGSAEVTCIDATANVVASWIAVVSGVVTAPVAPPVTPLTVEVYTASFTFGTATYTTVGANQIIVWDELSANTASITNSGGGIFTVGADGVYQVTLTLVSTASTFDAYIYFVGAPPFLPSWMYVDSATSAQSSVTYTRALTAGTQISSRIVQAGSQILGFTAAIASYSYMQILRLS